MWQKQLYKCGCGASPPGSLGQFADDADQGRVLVLEALVVSPEVGQALQLLFQLSGLVLQGPALESLQLQEGRPLCKALLPLRGALQLHLELRQPQRGLRQGLTKSLVLNAQLCVELPEAAAIRLRFGLGFRVGGARPPGGRAGLGGAGFWADVRRLGLLPLRRPSPLLANSAVLPGGLWSLSLPVRVLLSGQGHQNSQPQGLGAARKGPGSVCMTSPALEPSLPPSLLPSGLSESRPVWTSETGA